MGMHTYQRLLLRALCCYPLPQEITSAVDGQARLEKAELGAMPQIFAANKAMTTTSRAR